MPIASSSVDLPVPFSPQKNVMRWARSSSCRLAMAGTSNGYASRRGTPAQSMASEVTKMSSRMARSFRSFSSFRMLP